MSTQYRIHPAIGIARLGNSPTDFCISPEEPAALPLECDAMGNPSRTPDGQSERRVTKFKDNQGRIKRQAARFRIYVYDETNPEGRPLSIGDPISGGGNQGVLIDIQWRVHLANKKASWYRFKQLEGEHGYSPDHPRRNASVTADEARQRLIIDPGPRMVDAHTRRQAQFDRDGGNLYATSFPPPLKPLSIDTLGELKTDNEGRLLVLGGHGNSGSYLYNDFAQPRIDDYANNDGWFDDTSDGPVTARLVMYSKQVGRKRYIDVEYPAWVLVGYPAYVPEILDLVTMDDLIEDMSIRNFAYRTDLYGEAGTFDNPQVIDPTDTAGLVIWQSGRLRWNPDYRPWFYRDIWPILFRPDEFSYLNNILGQSNYPHNQSPRGNLDPRKLGVPPQVNWVKVKSAEAACIAKQHSGELLIGALEPALDLLEKQAQGQGEMRLGSALLSTTFADTLRNATSAYAAAKYGAESDAGFRLFMGALRGESAAGADAGADTAGGAPEERLQQAIQSAIDKAFPGDDQESLRHGLEVTVNDQLSRYLNGKLLEECRSRAIVASTTDTYRDFRTYLFDLLRRPGEENVFRIGAKPDSRVHGLPLMPLLCGDNPLSNYLPSKFFRLTDYQYFLLRQWSLGLFINEEREGWGPQDPWQPYTQGWTNKTGRDLDRGVLSNLLGGSFCPGAEAGWNMRNPAIYLEPYRIKADPDFSSFSETAAQANANEGQGGIPETAYGAYLGSELSQDDNFNQGIQPGDITKHMAVPWQSDFNECTTQPIDVTYETWVKTYKSQHDSLMEREQKVWDTIWWPGHRPMQAYELSGFHNGQAQFKWVDWSLGIPQTNAGDLKMATEWWRLGFILRNPYLPAGNVLPSEAPPIQKYIAVERSDLREEP
jgi:hypothetical protein